MSSTAAPAAANCMQAAINSAPSEPAASTTGPASADPSANEPTLRPAAVVKT